MADDVNVTEGSGKVIATQERAGGRHFQQMIDTGSDSIASARVDVAAGAAVQIVAARANRKRVVIQSLLTSTGNVDIGTSGVTDTTGFTLQPGDGFTAHTCAAIYGDTASGTQHLSVWEEYD
jgi:hypothetical protein